ncbi:HAD family hydrolase [Tateyamaria omphalii]|uniref:Haloacid dehalogenase n=1 Tax=Tateyamaria omphalii TaxID=299262 RepID=A0A1P8MZ81_9RHOB|nr:HAD family phosphatase [Tateyamaria omphalii]APX13209.1 haloacid dehalogenase [Tateyamaria omphalii]
MTIQAVIFDIGNVLIEWQPERFYDSVIGEDRRRALFSEVDLNGMNLEVDRGAPFAQSVHDLAAKHPKWDAEIKMWHDRWIEMASPQIDHSVRLMAALQAKGTPVFSLTNFGVDTYDRAAQDYPFMRQFNRDFISGHMRVIKPDPTIYQRLEEESGLRGENLIFTDDRSENIAAAQMRGWRTHLFKGPDGWAKRLVTEGVLTESEAA